LLKEVTPKPVLNENVIVQFVPLAKDPLAEFDLKSSTVKPLIFFDSVVLLRIIVRPTKSNVIFRQGGEASMPELAVEEAEGGSWVDALLNRPQTCFPHERCLPCREPVLWSSRPEDKKIATNL
jgi:hypothetical protein